MKLALAGLAALLTFAAARALADEPLPVDLKPGDRILICRTGMVTCPSGPVRCDAEGIVRAEDTPRDGIALVAVAPGTTLCGVAAASGLGPRRVFRVTVAAARKPN